MYIHQSTCISPQQTFIDIDLNLLNPSVNNILRCIEPSYDGIPLNILRRMGRAVKMGVRAALPIMQQTNKIDGIIIGTGNGGMEDCIKFLNQIIQYEEGRLTPTNFVQSTPNAIASQIGLTAQNHNYNITHVHRGLAFENSLIDACMQLVEKQKSNYIVGGIDEISTYNYNIEYMGNWFKKESISNSELYLSNSNGSIAGEGSVMFLVNNKKENALAKVQQIKTLHNSDPIEVILQLKLFLETNLLQDERLDIFISGENGDNRFTHYYESCEKILNTDTGICRFKHYAGEYPSSSAIALWLACQLLNMSVLPIHFIKRSPIKNKDFKNILIYNNYKGLQHSFIFLRK